ncbi:hypothetical protein AYL99_03423 [Fonsecaea erecta]|uniref:Uncharacterized protein n=1 Tax=Fonsecaea erecta TaxID=1367422 RepID=A0A178ZNJ4_9EURO|nr:hypothetical protein AYL99_03423 [Fonsecaea erecta]OAP61222.1 hypothetical protein AYL99_03423 [Fonsecaea erecta]
MRRRIVDIEDRVEGNYDEHVRLRDRVVAVDDATMSVEKRVEELEDFRFKRRRVSRNNTQDQPSQNGYVSSDPDNFRRVPSSVDGGSVRTPSSRALSPNGTAPAPVPEPEEPRSSGILNLVAEMPRPGPFVNLPQRLSPPQEEPRSSGFLTLGLGERLKEKPISEQVAQISIHQASQITPPQDRSSPSSSAKSNQDVPIKTIRTPPDLLHTKMPLIDVMVLPGNISPRKRKHHLDHIALDVLADVTVASPLIH